MCEGPRRGYRRVTPRVSCCARVPWRLRGTVRPGDSKKSEEKPYDRASMGTLLRFFVIDRDGNPRRHPLASFGALAEGAVPVPEWAATPFLCAEVAVWSENRRPV